MVKNKKKDIKYKLIIAKQRLLVVVSASEVYSLATTKNHIKYSDYD